MMSSVYAWHFSKEMISFPTDCIKFAMKQAQHHWIRSLLRFVHPWVASDPKKMHPFRSHQIGKALTPQLDTQRSCASYCNDISQRPPFRTLTFSKMFCNTSCSSSDLSCGQVLALRPNLATSYDYDQLQPPHHHHLPRPPIWPPWWIQKPPVDGLESKKVFSGKYLQNKIHEKRQVRKKWSGLWRVVSGEWKSLQS